MTLSTTHILGLGVAFSLGMGCGPVLQPAESDHESGSAGTAAEGSGSGVVSTSGPPATSGVTTLAPGTGDSSGSTFIAGTDTDTCASQPGDPDWRCSFECTVFESDQCPDGDKCMPWDQDGSDEWDSTRCSPLDPQPAAEGEACEVVSELASGIDDCAEGSMCWGVDPSTLTGTCRSFCDPMDVASCGETRECVAMGDDSFALCLTRCNPIEPSACADDEGCRFIASASIPYCLPLQGGVVTGSSMRCNGGDGCGLDSLCLWPSYTPVCELECCSPWCDRNDPTADDTCALIDPAMYCLPMFPEGAPPKGPLEGLAALGVCGIDAR